MRLPATVALAFLLTAPFQPAARAETCPNPENALGVSRIVEIDTKAGPLFGEFTKQETEPRFLGPKEVVLTFDDGPIPRYTGPILEALDKFCTKATFFYVGRMAMAYPDMVKEVMGRGHTLGTHTWSHPMNLRHRGLTVAKDQIERGIAAVELAAGRPIAPFFRFPGLSDSGPMLAYLQGRGIAAFTVDVVSNDSYISSPKRLAQRTLAQIEKQNGGIVLFHDIKASTAKALPEILSELKSRGYTIVHLQTKSRVMPLANLTAQLKAKRDGPNTSSDDQPALVPIHTAIVPSTLGTVPEPAVTEIAPEARERVRGGASQAVTAAPTGEEANEPKRRTRSRPTRKRRAGKKAKVSAITVEPVSSLAKAVTAKY